MEVHVAVGVSVVVGIGVVVGTGDGSPIVTSASGFPALVLPLRPSGGGGASVAAISPRIPI